MRSSGTVASFFRFTGTSLAMALISMVGVASAQALPGDPDPAYGQDGLFSRSIGPGPDQHLVDFDSSQSGHVMAIVRNDANMTRIARLTADGHLDQGFGAGGYIEPAGPAWDSIALDSSGRILVATSSGSEAVVSRFLPGGTIDHSFGTGGTWQMDLLPLAGALTPEYQADFNPDLYELKVLDDGSVAVGGNVADCDYDYGGYSEGYFTNCPGQVAIRLTPRCSADAGFDADGVRLSVLPYRTSTIRFLPDGRSVVFGGYVEDSYDGGIGKKIDRGEDFPAKRLKLLNELPFILMILVVILVIVKPF